MQTSNQIEIVRKGESVKNFTAIKNMSSANEFAAHLNRVDLHNGGQKKFVTIAMSFLDKHEADYVKKLRSWVRAGEKKCFHSFCMIRILQFCGKGYLLQHDSEQSILHLTTTFHSCHRLAEEILLVCPDLAVKKRTGEHSGLTALHILVSKDAQEATQHFLGLPSVKQCEHQLFRILADGSRFNKTNLMGQTVLSAAALNFCFPLVVTLLDAGADLMQQNNRGDTVLHSLVRYANLFPDSRTDVVEMMASLQEHILLPKEGDKALWGKRYARKVWFCRNRDNMTALQLAATLGEHQIVCFIMNLQWVYRTLYDYNGIFETNLYDITEIDTLAGEEWSLDQSVYQTHCWWKDLLRNVRMVLCCSRTFAQRSLCGPPVMEKICEVDIASACHIISTPVVTKLISDKWKMCKIFFYIWGLLHLAEMIFMTVYAYNKFEYVDYLRNNNETMLCHNPTNVTGWQPRNKAFIDITCALFLGLSFFTIYLELIRTFVHRKPWNLHLIHHNGSFRLVLLLKALVIAVDCFWYFACPGTNDRTPLVLALLLGWFFCTFFLRPFKIFSFFTVMLMRVLLGDMLRFFSIIVIELVSFTLVMFLLFQNNSGEPPAEFKNWHSSFLTMFQLMLGITEIEVLSQAEPAWLAITLFVVYILLTYVLLINSLIAMMSITCAEIAGEKVNQWKIQRLSVILFLEKLLPCGLARLRGRRLYYHRRQDRGSSISSQGEMRFVITDTTSSNKHPSAISVDRSISQDKDEVDTELDNIHSRAVIVTCPDDDIPSQPPSPTASLGDEDFSPIKWLSPKRELNSYRDSDPYIELDAIGKSSQQDCILDGANDVCRSLSTELEVHDSLHGYASCSEIDAILATPGKSEKPKVLFAQQPECETDEAVEANEAEYGTFGVVGERPEMRRPQIYTDPHWASLLESIRSYDDTRRRTVLRRQSSYMQATLSRKSLGRNRLHSKKLRDEFIFKGQEKSMDDIYSTLDDNDNDEGERELADPF